MKCIADYELIVDNRIYELSGRSQFVFIMENKNCIGRITFTKPLKEQINSPLTVKHYSLFIVRKDHYAPLYAVFSNDVVYKLDRVSNITQVLDFTPDINEVELAQDLQACKIDLDKVIFQ